MTFNPISQDPPKDKKFPPQMVGLEIDSHEATLNGVLYIASGEEAHPTMLLLHGYPGHERNTDLAHIFRRAGWNVVVFHYRGAWGSGGTYRFAHLLEDTKVVVDYFKQPHFAAQHLIDPEKIITVGHSMGGWVSLMMATQGVVTHAASLAGANIGVWSQQLIEYPDMARPALREMLFGEGIAPLNGVNLDNEIDDLIANADTWNFMQHIDTLQKANLLLVAAKRDSVVPVFDHHFPLIEALGDGDNIHSKMLDTEHGFSDARIALAEAILDWLKTI